MVSCGMEISRATTASGLTAVPQKIGKYEIISELGKGATSAVYRAYDPFQNRQVAIKVVFPEALGDQEYGRRYRKLFVTEASLAGKLSHPHIAAIYDAVAGEEASYIVMEYVDGSTLEQYTHHDSLLPVQRIVEIVFKCAKALEYASNQGVIHRDIKPANILLAGETDIKVSDFGAALTQAAETTQVSGIGSPAYMSPEQVKEQQLSHQTDIFSLGVVMYQLLTGRLPFQGANNYSMIYQIINVDPPPPIEVRPDIPPRIDAIVMRALQKDTARRYQTWDEFAHDLATALGAEEKPGRGLRREREVRHAAQARVLPPVHRRRAVGSAAHRELAPAPARHGADSRERHRLLVLHPDRGRGQGGQAGAAAQRAHCGRVFRRNGLPRQAEVPALGQRRGALRHSGDRDPGRDAVQGL